MRLSDGTLCCTKEPETGRPKNMKDEPSIIEVIGIPLELNKNSVVLSLRISRTLHYETFAFLFAHLT